ncbi:hypothetical protein HDU76_008982 [Blyttiomyces sp. JEL0837]|nr:hypothetical protein HDU76_008982 [Blyttiomyces sp. JEL0837]
MSKFYVSNRTKLEASSTDVNGEEAEKRKKLTMGFELVSSNAAKASDMITTLRRQIALQNKAVENPKIEEVLKRLESLVAGSSEATQTTISYWSGWMNEELERRRALLGEPSKSSSNQAN